jgi:integrase
MPHRPKIRWHAPANAWRSDVGPYGKNGRRTPVYFREIPNTSAGRRKADAALEDYLRARDRAEAEAVHDAANPRLWVGVVKPYLAHLRKLVDAHERGERTLRSHAERLKRFLDFAPTDGPYAGVPMGRRLAPSLVDDDAARFITALKADGCGPRRIDGILRSLDACFNWAARPVAAREPRRLIPANPFLGIERDKVPRKARRLPTRAEFARFLRAARREVEAWTAIPGGRCSGCVRSGRFPDRPCRRSHGRRAMHDRAVLLLCRLQFHCGTRPDELCGATWDEVRMPGQDVGEPGWTSRAWRDPATRQWWGRIVVFGKTSRPKGELRRVPVPPLLARAIERVRAARLHPRWIFPRAARGGSGRWDSTALAGKVRPWRDAAALGGLFVLYALRHRMYTAAVHRSG